MALRIGLLPLVWFRRSELHVFLSEAATGRTPGASPPTSHSADPFLKPLVHARPMPGHPINGPTWTETDHRKRQTQLIKESADFILTTYVDSTGKGLFFSVKECPQPINTSAVLLLFKKNFSVHYYKSFFTEVGKKGGWEKGPIILDLI